MVTQRTANPSIPVRFWAWPPNLENTSIFDSIIIPNQRYKIFILFYKIEIAIKALNYLKANLSKLL